MKKSKWSNENAREDFSTCVFFSVIAGMCAYAAYFIMRNDPSFVIDCVSGAFFFAFVCSSVSFLMLSIALFWHYRILKK